MGRVSSLLARLPRPNTSPGVRAASWRVLPPLLLSLTSVATALAGGELALRWLYPRKAVKPTDMSAIGFEFSPEYLVRLKPDTEKVFPTGGDDGKKQISWSTNADGFRGPALRSAAARVIVYGDSNVLARFTELEHTFPVLLERALGQATGRDIEVLNAGIVGAGPDQVLLRFEQDAPRYRPQLAVFVLFADNDWGDIVRNRLFELDASGALVPTTHERRVDPLLAEGSYQDGLSRFLLVRALRRLVEDYPNAILSRLEYAVYTQGAPPRFSHFADHYDTDVALAPQAESSTTKRALLARVLERARASAQANGVRLFVVVVPSGRDLTTNETPNHEDFARYPEYAPAKLSALAADTAVAAGIATLDLYGPFLAADASRMYRKRDNHWSEAGQAVAAAAASEAILTQRLLE